MNDIWVQILGQIPFVAVFVWFALETGKQNRETQKLHIEQNEQMQKSHAEQNRESQIRFMDALDKRDASFEARSQAIIETMNTNNRMVLDTLARMEAAAVAHDDMVREKLAVRSRSSRAKVKEDAIV